MEVRTSQPGAKDLVAQEGLLLRSIVQRKYAVWGLEPQIEEGFRQCGLVFKGHLYPSCRPCRMLCPFWGCSWSSVHGIFRCRSCQQVERACERALKIRSQRLAWKMCSLTCGRGTILNISLAEAFGSQGLSKLTHDSNASASALCFLVPQKPAGACNYSVGGVCGFAG